MVTTRDHPQPEVSLRLASATDEPRLRTLAELDGARSPGGEVLIAEVDGRLRAALPLAGGEPIADPFHHTVLLVALLRMRADQLMGRDAPATTTLSAPERRFAHLRSAKPFAALRRLA